MTTFIDIHTLHTVPFSNLNRDDLGTPKQAIYGGATRARLSSASIKRSTRMLIEARVPDPSVRTRRAPARIRDLLVSQGWEPEPALTAAGHIAEVLVGLEAKDPERTKVLLLLTDSQIRALANEAAPHRDAYHAGTVKKAPWDKAADKKRFVAHLTKADGTIALLGRFVAELPETKVDGAVQVAHAITTHRADLEIDFFTAVDDLNAADDTGSGHMNTAELTQGTFYKMASLDCDQLLRNLDGDLDNARLLTRLFVDAFSTALPKGKVTATAANATVPNLVAVTVRNDRPINLVPAFESPVRADNGFISPSIAALDEYHQQITDFLGAGPDWAGYASPTHQVTSFGEQTQLRDLAERAVTHAFGLQ